MHCDTFQNNAFVAKERRVRLLRCTSLCASPWLDYDQVNNFIVFSFYSRPMSHSKSNKTENISDNPQLMTCRVCDFLWIVTLLQQQQQGNFDYFLAQKCLSMQSIEKSSFVWITTWRYLFIEWTMRTQNESISNWVDSNEALFTTGFMLSSSSKRTCPMTARGTEKGRKQIRSLHRVDLCSCVSVCVCYWLLCECMRCAAVCTHVHYAFYWFLFFVVVPIARSDSWCFQLERSLPNNINAENNSNQTLANIVQRRCRRRVSLNSEVDGRPAGRIGGLTVATLLQYNEFSPQLAAAAATMALLL